MNPILIISLIAVSACMVQSAPAAEKGQRLRLKDIIHRPCSSKSNGFEKIRFPDLAQAPIKEDKSRGDGCYTISGPVNVRKSISGDVQIYTEIRFGTKGSPEPCQKADSNGCGGSGSCVYCDACKNVKTIEKVSSGLVQIESTDGTTLDCQRGVKSGNYTNIKISFCLPTKDEVLKSEKIDEQFYDEYAKNGRTFFVTMYVINDKVNGKSSSQLRSLVAEPNARVIGCHKIVGNVYAVDE